jgi:alpha-tubulin suppressor-like RCC1 family protein
MGDATLRCWGRGSDGQTGDGSTTEERRTPAQVVGVTGATAVAVGFRHACALLRDGRVGCWGYNDTTTLGRPRTPSGPYPLFEPLATPLDGVALHAGSEHTCVVPADGRIRCWGQNSQGQRGTGDRTNNTFPNFAVGDFDVYP